MAKINPTDREIAQWASENADTSNAEIDSDAAVSRAADGSGAFVQAWVWVAFSDMEETA